MSRPLLIRTINWSSGSFNTEFQPWREFISHPTVVKKLDNYLLLRGTLVLKVILNGGPFTKGRAWITYTPRHLLDEYEASLLPLGPQGSISQSQKPKVILDPTTSTGGIIKCPFFKPENWIDLTDSTDHNNMGTARFVPVAAFQDFNDPTTVVDVQVFAWMEDVTLSSPTQLEVQGEDEYGKGIVSRPASVVAAVAGAMVKAPFVGPYARATEMLASGISSMARLLGFSRPLVVESPCFYKNLNAGNYASTDRDETALKLAFDSKQELTIDPRTVGLANEDEMLLRNIWQRESYVNQFTWSPSQIEGTNIFHMRVHPGFFAALNGAHYLTSLAFGTIPFEYWRGTINVRFSIVATAFHRGRLRIMYDPQVADDGTSNFNETFNRIIDLSSDRDIVIPIKWHQVEAWRKTGLIGLAAGATVAPIVGVDNEQSNGIITVQVLTQLKEPGVNNDPIDIIASIAAGDDFEVMGVSDFLETQTYRASLASQSEDCSIHSLDPCDRYFNAEHYAYNFDNLEMLSDSLHTFDSDTSFCEEEFSVSDLFGSFNLWTIPFVWARTILRNEYRIIYEEEQLETQGDESGTPGSQTTSKADIPEHPDTVDPVGGTPDINSNILKVFGGEKIASIRNILKRYCLYQLIVDGKDATGLFVQDHARFPLDRGFVDNSNGLHTSATGGTSDYNYVANTFLSYFTPAFVGWRGSIRHKFTLVGDSSDGCIFTVKRSSNIKSPGDYERLHISDPTGVAIPAKYASNYLDNFEGSMAGITCNMSNNNATAEIDVPYFENRRFSDTRLDRNADAEDDGNFRYLRMIINTTNPNPCPKVLHAVAAGEDFALFGYIGAPRMYFYINETFVV